VSDYPCWLTSLKTAPTDEPITLEDAKTHLRETGTDEDDLILSLIQAAREYVETFTSRALMPQTWYWKADRFPVCEPVWLPRPPLVSITSVSYVDETGATQTWAATTGYQLSQPSRAESAYAQLAPAYGTSIPTTRYQFDAVTSSTSPATATPRPSRPDQGRDAAADRPLVREPRIRRRRTRAARSAVGRARADGPVRGGAVLMRAGLLRQRVTIQSMTAGTDGQGGTTKTFATLASSVPAAVLPLSGIENGAGWDRRRANCGRR
jgi:uncharacterized phiE125 gp8 family phage protein